MDLCCYGCGLPGIFEFKDTKKIGKKRCSKFYRSCPVKRKEGGDKKRGTHLSKEHKENISKGTIGRKTWNKGLTSKEDGRIISGSSHPFFGKFFSEEHRKNLSNSNFNKGKTLSNEQKIKIGKSLLGSKNGMFGKKHSDETRKKISDVIITGGSCSGEKNGNYNKDLDREGIKSYRSKVMRLSRKTYKDFKDEINPDNLEISSNKFHLDHIIPISLGFKHKIDPEIMSNKINLQILFYKHNIKKGNTMINEELFKQLLSLGQI